MSKHNPYEDDREIYSNSRRKGNVNDGYFDLNYYVGSDDSAVRSHRKAKKQTRWSKLSGLAHGLTYFWLLIALLVVFATVELVVYKLYNYFLFRWGLLILAGGGLLLLGISYLFLPLNHRKAQRIISAVLAVILAFGVAVSVLTPLWNWADAHLSKVIYNYDDTLKNKSDEDLGISGKFDEKVVNIALFGIDTRDPKSFEGRSDSIMVLSLDTRRHTVKIVSIVRDSFVPIEGHGYGKINSAYAYGGPELMIKTINQVFNLNIREYATVNFYGMAEIIDAVGGIDVELSDDEVKLGRKDKYDINGTIGEICGHLKKNPKNYYITKTGKQHLNGIQAVGYSRIRHYANIWGTNNDYGRTERQRYVMEQLFNKALKMDGSRYSSFAKSLMPYTKTSLTLTEVVDLANTVMLRHPTFDKNNIPYIDLKNGINMRMVAPTNQYGSVEYYDTDYAAKLIHAFFYDNITFLDYAKENGVETNSWYRGGGSSSGSGNSGSYKPSQNTTSQSQQTNSQSSTGQNTSSEITSSEITSSEITSSENNESQATSSEVTPSESTSSSTEPPPSGGGDVGGGETPPEAPVE